MTQKELDVIQEKIGYKFKEQYLLTQAFTRRSYAAENQNREDNEKLEFVGDKVLDFIVVKKLTNLYGFKSEALVQTHESVKKSEPITENNLVLEKNFEFSFSEGEMTEIKKQVVQTSFLSKAIEKLELEKYLLMGNGDIKNNVQNEPHVKEDLLEAIIGAVSIDSSWNMDAIEKVIDKILSIDYYIQNGVDDGIDYISYVQNWHQKKYGKEPEYNFSCTGENGIFVCDLLFDGYIDGCFDGIGYSKKEAIRITAKRAYEYLQKKDKSSNNIFDIIGDFDFESSINKLQMLQDKKIITGLDYIFREEQQAAGSNGNPMWFCQCMVKECAEFVEYGHETKKMAKKAAAFKMLQILTGEPRDKEEWIAIQKMLIKENF